jgi:dihydroneopterin triphosphate diphosphatase
VSPRLIDVFPYRMVEGRLELLLLRRADSVIYAGQWRMVGGKIREGEKAWEAALRELKEETGREPVHFWSVPSLNAFYEWQTDRINLIPVFAAELDRDPSLDDEHSGFMWVTLEAAEGLVLWPEQRRLLRLIADQIERGIPPELVVRLSIGPDYSSPVVDDHWS